MKRENGTRSDKIQLEASSTVICNLRYVLGQSCAAFYYYFASLSNHFILKIVAKMKSLIFAIFCDIFFRVILRFF